MPSPPDPDSHRLSLLALATLEDLLAQAHVGRVQRSWGIRLALTWLQRAGIAEPWQARQLWDHLDGDRTAQDWESNARYIDLTVIIGALDGWSRRAGINPEDLYWPRHHRARALAPELDTGRGSPHLLCMCNRYQPGERTAIAPLFAARPVREFNSGPPIVHPREPGWVVRLVDGEPVLDQMTWGFPVYVRGRIGQRGQPLKPKPVNNARFDKLGTFWKRWAAEPSQRCLIPAARFAEAVGTPGQMTTTWLSLKSTSVFAWAGLWGQSEEWGPVYTGVMTSSCAELIGIHDRSPVIIAPDRWADWLNAPLTDLARFDQPWPASDIAVQRTNVLWKHGGEPETLPPIAPRPPAT